MTARGRICVSLAPVDLASLEAMDRALQTRPDVIEIRLDAMADPDVSGCRRRLDAPLLFTHRPTWEGGGYSGSEEDRLGPLVAAIEAGAAYVDFELRGDRRLRERLLARAGQGATRLILSWHHFQGTPTSRKLGEILAQIMDSGAPIGKIVTLAHEPGDVIRVLGLLEKALQADFPLIAFCMGEAGRISRLATLFLGGYMSYAAASEELATAPGQLSVAHLERLCAQFES